jgi:hypothetical protein
VIRLRNPVVRTILAATLAFAVCLSTALTAGTRAAGWAAAAGVLVAALALLARLTPAPTVVSAPRASVRAQPKVGYPRYDRLAAMLSWALRDPRYFDRMLWPLLRDIALDLQRSAGPGAAAAELRAALGERFVWLLDGPERDQVAAAGPGGRPGRAELSALVDRLNELERSWT